MRTVIATLVCIGAGIGLLAHHDISQTFDQSRTVEARGIVSKVFWGNPHPTIEIRQPGQDGTTTTWLLELQGNPKELEGRGWTRTSITIGEAILARGYPARPAAVTQPPVAPPSTTPPPKAPLPTISVLHVSRADGSQLDASSSTQWTSSN